MSVTAERMPTPRDIERWRPPERTPQPAWHGWRDRLARYWLVLFSGLVLLYLFVPIIVTVLFSFNDNLGRFNFTWRGFTIEHWRTARGYRAYAPRWSAACRSRPSPRSVRRSCAA